MKYTSLSIQYKEYSEYRAEYLKTEYNESNQSLRGVEVQEQKKYPLLFSISFCLILFVFFILFCHLLSRPLLVSKGIKSLYFVTIVIWGHFWDHSAPEFAPSPESNDRLAGVEVKGVETCSDPVRPGQVRSGHDLTSFEVKPR